jgi:hypothetical protein
MPSEERDRQFERALQRHLGSGAPDAMCPDAEILAACHDGTLSLEELTHWKEHMATCERCQETLALLEETNKVTTEEWESKELVGHTSLLGRAMPSSAPSKQMSAEGLKNELPVGATTSPIVLQQKKKMPSSLRWAVPVGALAAALLIFVSVRESSIRTASSMKATQMAENRQTAAPQPPASMNGSDETRQEKLAEPSQAATDARKKSEGQSLSSKKLAAPRMQPSNNAFSYAAGASESDKLKEEEMSRRLDVKPGIPRPNAAPVPQRSGNSPAMVSAPPPPAPAIGFNTGVAGEAQTEQAPTVANSAKAKESLNDRATQQPGRTASYSAALGRNLNSLHEIAAKNPHVIAAPDSKHAWRVGPAGTIEFTSNAGVDWKQQKSGVSGELTAGSAPSAEICWVVGKAGTVLLTTDGGKHWKPITSPLQENLAGVHAVDANHAAIWNVGNQKNFETSDGGVTWSVTANE